MTLIQRAEPEPLGISQKKADVSSTDRLSGAGAVPQCSEPPCTQGETLASHTG